MAGKLERTMWEMKTFIKDAELSKKFDEIYQQVVEQNKNNLVAMIKVGYMGEETLDVGEMQWGEDYEINSGTRKDEDGNEFSTEEEYLAHIESKANYTFGLWTITKVENPKESEREDYPTIHEVYDEDGEKVGWEYLESEAKDLIEIKKEEWIEEKPEFNDLEIQYHEIYWNRVWQFNDEVNKEVADKVGLGYLHHNQSGEEYLFLLGCGMDLTPEIIAYQALAHGYIEEKHVKYFEGSMLSYTIHVMGKKIFAEVLEALGVADIYVDGDAE